MRTKVTQRGQREGYSVFLVPFLVNYFPADIADLRRMMHVIIHHFIYHLFLFLKLNPSLFNEVARSHSPQNHS